MNCMSDGWGMDRDLHAPESVRRRAFAQVVLLQCSSLGSEGDPRCAPVLVHKNVLVLAFLTSPASEVEPGVPANVEDERNVPGRERADKTSATPEIYRSMCEATAIESVLSFSPVRIPSATRSTDKLNCEV
jgi:hypothetical protein